MPTVRYTIPQQGFRPKTNPLGALNSYGRRKSLRGLGDAGVPTGSTLTYQGQWQTTNTMTANDIINAVIMALASYGLAVTNSQSSAGLLANTKFIFAEGGQHFTVQLQLLVNGPGFAQASDAGSIVDHAVYMTTGLMPLSSQTIGGGMGVSGAVAAPGAAATVAPTDVTTWLEQNALWLGLGIAAAVVLPQVL